MILFVNIRVTSKTLDTYYERGLFDRPERYLVCCYALASLRVIPWSAVRLYIDFDETQIQHRDTVLNYARRLFPEAIIRPYQLANQRQWQEAILELDDIDDKLVCFLCNDDQVFIDNSLETILGLERLLLRLMEENPFISGALTSWTEYLAMSIQDPSLRIEDNFLLINAESIDSAQLVTKAILKSWWFTTDYGECELRRTDWGRCVQINYKGVLVIPRREILCHFDASHHVGIDYAIVPPLEIPAGFFEQQIRLQYGGSVAPGITLVDPLNPDHAAFAPGGANWQSTLDEIPLFWRSAIADTVIVRRPTKGDQTAAAAVYLRKAAAGIKSENNMFLMHELMRSLDHGKQILPRSELFKHQGVLNRSWANHLRNNGLHVFKVGNRRRPTAISLVIEDLDFNLANQINILELPPLNESGGEVVWIGLGFGPVCTAHGRYWGNVKRAMKIADRVGLLFPSNTSLITSGIAATMHMAMGEVVIWLNSSKATTENILLMLNDPIVLEKLLTKLSLVNNDLIILVDVVNDHALSIRNMIGVATLRSTALHLIASRPPSTIPNKLTACYLSALPLLNSGYLGIDFTGFPAGPAQFTDLSEDHKKTMDVAIMNQEKTMDSFLESLFELDDNEDATIIIEFLKHHPSTTDELYTAMFQLLSKLRLRLAFIIALILEDSGCQDLLVSFAISVGGLSQGDSRSEARGLERLWSQNGSPSVVDPKMLREHIVVPVISHLLVAAIESSDFDREQRAIDLLKAAIPQFRTETHLELSVVNGILYKKLF